jgi:hypothetical protein
MGASPDEIEVLEVLGTIVKTEKRRLSKDGGYGETSAPLGLILGCKVVWVEVEAHL